MSGEDLFGYSVYEGLNEGQKKAMKVLLSDKNVFLTGGAGVGKSYITKRAVEEMRDRGDQVSVVASTGTAATLIGGTTIHRCFGFNTATDISSLVTASLKKGYVRGKLHHMDCLLIDEISMIPDYLLEAANLVAQEVRGSKKPWGGLKVIAVGDFRQLPPIAPRKDGDLYGRRDEKKPWSFLTKAWEKSKFVPAILDEPVRSIDPVFVRVLKYVRVGILNDEVRDFLNARKVGNVDLDIPRLFPKNADVERHNQKKLEELPGDYLEARTRYTGSDYVIERLKKDCILPEFLRFKVGALVMMRQNDVDDQYVNGSIGHVRDFVYESGRNHLPSIVIDLKNGNRVTVKPSKFFDTNELGEVQGHAENYPVTLAWAWTIHKSQGASLDAALMDISRMWEPGQMYVALSRIREPDGVKLVDWSPSSFLCDEAVDEFHKTLKR